MGIFDFFKKKDKLDKDVEKIFAKVHKELTAKQMTNQAISYRNLGQFDKAITLLNEAIKKYQYLPAESILGNTLVAKGDIDGAEMHFKKCISEHINKGDFPLIELYANLGSLYNNHKEDINSALKYYELALNAPQPKDIGIDEKGYDFMASGVFLDLCGIYYYKEDFQSAKAYSFKRLQTVKDCPKASRIYAYTLFFEWMKMKGLAKDIKDLPLNDIIKYLQVALAANPADYSSLAYCAIALCHMRTIEIYKGDRERDQSLERQEKEYVERLKKDCTESGDAKAAYKIYRGWTISDNFEFAVSYEFDPSKFLSFIQERAYEKGIVNCPNCGKPDIFFSLSERCVECGKFLPRRDEIESFLFAVEIMREFIHKYTEMIPLDVKRSVLIFFNNLIRTCLLENALPQKADLKRLASFLSIGPMGGERCGFLIEVKKGEAGKVSIATEGIGKLTDREEFGRSVGAILNAINFAANFGENAGNKDNRI